MTVVDSEVCNACDGMSKVSDMEIHLVVEGGNKVKHSCKICKELVQHDMNSISAHVNHKHALPLGQYIAIQRQPCQDVELDELDLIAAEIEAFESEKKAALQEDPEVSKEDLNPPLSIKEDVKMESPNPYVAKKSQPKSPNFDLSSSQHSTPYVARKTTPLAPLCNATQQNMARMAAPNIGLRSLLDQQNVPCQPAYHPMQARMYNPMYSYQAYNQPQMLPPGVRPMLQYVMGPNGQVQQQYVLANYSGDPYFQQQYYSAQATASQPAKIPTQPINPPTIKEENAAPSTDAPSVAAASTSTAALTSSAVATPVATNDAPIGADGAKEVKTRKKRMKYDDDPDNMRSNKKDITRCLRWNSHREYHCNTCTDFMAKDYRPFHDHVTEVHKAQIKDNNIGAFMVTHRVHVCRICSKIIKLRTMEAHLRQSHNISVFKYHSAHFADDEMSTKSKKDPQDNTHMALKWASQQYYDCKACTDYSSLVIGNLKVHISKRHKLKMPEYTKTYGNVDAKSRTHLCKLCSGELVHNYKVITGHLKSEHSLTLYDYFNKHIVTAGVFGHESGTTQVNDLRDRAKAWVNQCVYECRVCQKYSSKSSRSFMSHLKTDHGMTRTAYKDEYGNCVTERKMHICNLCNIGVTHTLDSICIHLRIHHNMTVPEYYEKQIQHTDDDVEENRIETPVEVAGSEVLDEIKLLDSASEGADKFKEDVIKWHQHYEKSVVEWADQCVYTCKICNNFTTMHHLPFVQHIGDVHKTSINKYKEKHVRLFEKVCHKCKLCGCKITSTVNLLGRHLRLVHQTLLIDYWHAHIKTAGSNVAPKDVKITSEAKQIEEAKTQRKEEAKTSRRELEDTRNKMQMCKKWADQCSFPCKICKNFTTMHQEELIEHVERVHSMRLTRYKAQMGKSKSMIFNRVFHRCVVCQKMISHTSSILTQHLLKEHSLSLMDYWEHHISTLNGDETNRGNSLVHQIRRWSNNCKYRCKICNSFETTFMSSFQRHITTKHDFSRAQYNAQYSGAMAVREMYNCKICKRSVTHERSLLTSHFQNMHRMSLETYYRIYIQGLYNQEHDYAKPLEEDVEQVEEEDVSNFGDSIDQFAPEVKLVVKDEEEVPEKVDENVAESITEEVENKKFQNLLDKKFATKDESAEVVDVKDEQMDEELKAILADSRRVTGCKMCKHKEDKIVLFEKPEDLSKHLKEDHAIIHCQELATMSRWLHVCRLCAKEIDSDEVVEHLKTAHKTRVQEYLKPPHTKQDQLFLCEICPDQSTASYEDFIEHIFLVHDLEISEYRKMVEAVDPSAQVPILASQKRNTDDLQLPGSKVPKLEPTSEEEEEELWTDRCTLECKICIKLFKSKKTFVTHIGSAHSYTFDDYTEEIDDPFRDLTTFTCKFCKETMAWETVCIKDHLSQKHATNPDNYKKFMIKSGLGL